MACLFFRLFKYQVFASEEVPQVDHSGSDDFGEHVVCADTVGEEPDEKVVEPKSHDSYCGKEKELDNAVSKFRIVEYPNATDDVVDDQPGYEREGRREEIMQSGVFGEDIQ